jgi:DNA-binding NtrC family response regulator
MRQIFFIYRDAVVTELSKNILAKSGISTYVLNSVTENFSYLLNDLDPDLVLVDEILYAQSKDLIDESLKSSNGKAKWVYMTEDEDEHGPFHLKYLLPLKAKSLEDDLKYLVEQNPVKN